MNVEQPLSPSPRDPKGFQETKDLRERQDQRYDKKTVILKAFPKSMTTIIPLFGNIKCKITPSSLGLF